MTKTISLKRNKTKRNVSQLNKRNFIGNLEFLHTEKYKFFITLASIISIFLGALSYKYIENSQLYEIFFDNIDLTTSTEIKSIFYNLLKTDFCFILLNFFIGTSFLGSVVSIIPPMLKSLYIGFYSSCLYNNYELKGVLYCILLLYPCFAITTASLIFLSNENMYMSKYIYKCLSGEKNNDNISIKLYLFRYFILIFINIATIAVTSLIISFIGPKINLT